MADNDRSVLGDINPVPDRSDEERRERKADTLANQDAGPASDGSEDDGRQHAGARDVTEGTPGQTGGGTRNYRQSTGATGMDIGNRPE